MVREEDEIRAAERAIEWPEATDAGLMFIGRIHTPWTSRMDRPRQGRHDGPTRRIEVFATWAPALERITECERLEVLYWPHRSRRDLVLQSPRDDGPTRGTFARRSPVRPNPIGTSIVKLIGLEDTTLLARGLDCLDSLPEPADPLRQSVDRLEKSSCEAIFAERERLYQESYRPIPPLNELCARYGDSTSRKVYMMSRDVEGRWMDLHARETGVKSPMY